MSPGARSGPQPMELDSVCSGDAVTSESLAAVLTCAELQSLLDHLYMPLRLPRLRHLAASATIRGLKSTTDRLAATGLRRSRGHAQPAAQRLPIVEVKADMGFVVDVQTRSGAWCTFP